MGMKILFVCTGNQFRSPLAEILYKRKYPQHEYKSCGTGKHATEGKPFNSRLRKLLLSKTWMFDEKRSKPLTPELIEWADWIVCISKSHYDKAVKMGAEYSKCLILPDLGGIKKIQDPGFISGEMAMKTMFEQISKCVVDPRTFYE